MADEDEDSTPRTGSKQQSGGVIHLRLKNLESSVREGNAQNKQILQKLNEIQTELAVGSEKFKRQENEIAELKKVNSKAITGLIAGLGGLLAHAVKSIFNIH
jgi:hypothetical protein